MDTCGRCGKKFYQCRCPSIDNEGFTQAGRDSLLRFCDGRTDIEDISRDGKYVHVTFTDDTEMGTMDKVTGFWSWSDKP